MAQTLSTPILYEGKIVGHVVGGTYHTRRTPETLYRSIPCRQHATPCPGFTVSGPVLNEVEAHGAVFILVHFDSGHGHKHAYVTNVFRLKESAITFDNHQLPQYSLPLHAWVSVPEAR